MPCIKSCHFLRASAAFDLGLERTGGFKTVAFCEIDPFCRRVLAKHWPGVPCFEDVRELTGEQVGPVDVIAGGFPCQDISTAGRGAGLAGERSGLWSEYARLIGELRPLYVIVENVAALLGRGLHTVLGDLAALGYDAEWHCIPAAYVGAPHRRDRVWIVAYPEGERRGEAGQHCERPPERSAGCGDALADAESIGCGQGRTRGAFTQGEVRSPARSIVADAIRRGRSGPWEPVNASHQAEDSEGKTDHAFHVGFGDQWAAEPDVGRVANGVPDRAYRLRALGNAVVPQVVELIGRAILAADKERQAA